MRTTALMLVAAVALLARPSMAAPSSAAAEPGVCHRLVGAIDFDEKELESLEIDNTMEDSAPRATMRGTNQTYVMARINGNLALMAAHRCTPLGHPIDPAQYMLDALKCHTALMTSAADSDGAKAACDRSKWTRLEDGGQSQPPGMPAR